MLKKLKQEARRLTGLLGADTAISAITWRQAAREITDNEPTLCLSFANEGGGTWIFLETSGKFAFDSAAQIAALGVVAEELRAAHEVADVFG